MGAKTMRKAIISISAILIFSMIIAPINATNANSLWSEPRAIPEGSNYLEGYGNISYPAVSNISSVDSLISNTIVVGDVTGDESVEIIGISYLDHSLKVFDNELNLLWSFQERNNTALQKEKDYWDLIPAVAIGDVDDDGVMEIAFSLTSADSDSSILHLFKGNGTELWRLEVDGKITKSSLHMCDVNGDNKKEILFGAEQISVVSGNGTYICRSNIQLNDFQGISSIVVGGDRILATMWHYSKEELSDMASGPVNTSTRPIYSEYVLYYFIYGNNKLSTIWNISLETSVSSFSEYGVLFASPNFNKALLVKRNSLEIIDMATGRPKIEVENPGYYMGSPFSSSLVLTDSDIYWNEGTSLSRITWDGDVIWTIDAGGTAKTMFQNICLFNVDSAGEKLVAKMGLGELWYISVDDGSVYGKWNISTSDKESFSHSMIHADTDNDGYDEIITTDPEGRIVIIDSGTPPQDTEESGMTYEIPAFAGAIVFVAASMWMWRKRGE